MKTGNRGLHKRGSPRKKRSLYAGIAVWDVSVGELGGQGTESNKDHQSWGESADTHGPRERSDLKTKGEVTKKHEE